MSITYSSRIITTTQRREGGRHPRGSSGFLAGNWRAGAGGRAAANAPELRHALMSAIISRTLLINYVNFLRRET